MKVSTKLYGAVGSLALIGTLVAGSGIWYLVQVTGELNEVAGRTAVKLDLVNAARARSWEMVAALRGMFLFANLNDQAQLEASARRWGAAFKRAGEQVREIRPLLATEESRRTLARFEAGLDDFQQPAADYMRFCRERHFERIAATVPRLNAFTGLAEETLDSLKVQERKVLKDAQARAAYIGSQSVLVSVSLSCVLLAIVLLIVFVVRGIHRILSAAVHELSRGAEHVAAAARQVSASSQSLAEGSSEQAASLEETSAASEEINSMARRNSEHSCSAADLMTASQQKIAATNQSLEEMVEAMGGINTCGSRISGIIETIDGIAFQTNLLALNAAVEAARAGEAGLGFAVVADEVRNLAQRCSQAASDTTALIAESITRSNGGKAKVDQVAAAVRAITGEAAKVKTLVDEVNRGSREQARGIEQIGSAITRMEQVTQKTAASAEETASAAEELEAQADALTDVAERLSGMIGDGGASNGDGRRRKPAGRPRAEEFQELGDDVAFAALPRRNTPALR